MSADGEMREDGEMSEDGEGLRRGCEESAEDEALYLRLHHEHLHGVVQHATRLLHHARDPEQRAGVLHDLLQELYRHEERLHALRQAGQLTCAPRQLPSLVPVSIFMTAYLAGAEHCLAHSCRALRPFAGRSARCPVFSYVAERLGLLQEPPPRAAPDQLALGLRHIHAVLGGAPGEEAGPLAAQHARLARRYATCLARQRYRVRLEECKPLHASSRALQWLEETYAAALTDLRDAHLALSVVREAHAALLAAPYRLGAHLQDALRRAMAFFSDTVSQLLPDACQHTPAAPPRAPLPVMADIAPFFPSAWFSRRGSSLLLLQGGEPPPALMQSYLQLVSVLARVFDTSSTQLQTATVAHRHALLAALAAQDDCGLLQSLAVALRCLSTEGQHEAVRALCVAMSRAAVQGVKRAWASCAAPREPLDEARPVLRVTQCVRELGELARLHTMASPQDSVQDSVQETAQAVVQEVQAAYREVHGAFMTYLQRVAAQHSDLQARRYILLKNLLLLGHSYAQAEQHLHLHHHDHHHDHDHT